MSDVSIPDVTLRDNTNQRLPCVLVLDGSGSMAGSPIEELNAGLRLLEDELKKDDISKKVAYFSSGEVLPPRGLAAQLPVVRYAATHLIAELALTSNSSAASRREDPLSTLAITRPRISAE